MAGSVPGDAPGCPLCTSSSTAGSRLQAYACTGVYGVNSCDVNNYGANTDGANKGNVGICSVNNCSVGGEGATASVRC